MNFPVEMPSVACLHQLQTIDKRHSDKYRREDHIALRLSEMVRLHLRAIPNDSRTRHLAVSRDQTHGEQHNLLRCLHHRSQTVRPPVHRIKNIRSQAHLHVIESILSIRARKRAQDIRCHFAMLLKNELVRQHRGQDQRDVLTAAIAR